MKTTPCTIPKIRTPRSVVSVTYLRNMPTSSRAQVIASATATRRNRSLGVTSRDSATAARSGTHAPPAPSPARGASAGASPARHRCNDTSSERSTRRRRRAVGREGVRAGGDGVGADRRPARGARTVRPAAPVRAAARRRARARGRSRCCSDRTSVDAGIGNSSMGDPAVTTCVTRWRRRNPGSDASAAATIPPWLCPTRTTRSPRPARPACARSSAVAAATEEALVAASMSETLAGQSIGTRPALEPRRRGCPGPGPPTSSCRRPPAARPPGPGPRSRATRRRRAATRPRWAPGPRTGDGSAGVTTTSQPVALVEQPEGPPRRRRDAARATTMACSCTAPTRARVALLGGLVASRRRDPSTPRGSRSRTTAARHPSSQLPRRGPRPGHLGAPRPGGAAQQQPRRHLPVGAQLVLDALPRSDAARPPPGAGPRPRPRARPPHR